MLKKIICDWLHFHWYSIVNRTECHEEYRCSLCGRSLSMRIDGDQGRW